MNKNNKLSIIIVSYNTKKILDNCINSIYKSLTNNYLIFEIIVVDNNSIDKTKELITKKYPQIKFIQNSKNLGFGKANNQGVKAASFDTILLLNSDILVLNNAIEKLFNFFKLQSDKTIVGGKLFNPDLSPQSSCGPGYSLKNICLALLFKGDYLQITRYSPNTTLQVDWIMGACMMFNKQNFLQLGGFDEGIFMYMEEIDFEYRAKKANCKILFYPQAHFIHLGASSSIGRTEPIINVFRGLKYFYKKHKSSLENALLRVILLIKSILALLLFIILNNKSNQKLYIRAIKLVFE